MYWNFAGFFSLSKFLVSILYICTAYLTFYFLNRRRKLVKLVDEIPGRRLLSPLGDTETFCMFGSKNKSIPLLAEVFQNITGVAKLYGDKGITRTWLGFEPAVTITNYKMAEYILNSNTLIDKSFDYSLLHSWLGTGLLTSSGLKWKKRRKLLTPAFHFRILEDSLEVINDKSQILIANLAKDVDKDWIDIVPKISLCALDIISESAMGIAFNAQNDSESLYVKSIHEISSFIIDRGPKFWLWNDLIYSFTNAGKRYSECVSRTHEITKKVIENRKLTFKVTDDGGKRFDEFGNKIRQSFIDILLNEHMTTKDFTEENIAEEVNTFLFEGYDTTSAGMSWALYLIGLYPEIQQKIYEELESIFGDDTERPVNFEDIKNMKYLECVLKESLRLYPSVPYIGRTITKDTRFGEYCVPKGSRLWVFFYIIHRDPKVFPNPEEFIPERFLVNNSTMKNSYTFLPFSAGPRNCIGQKFAMMEEKTVISNVLRKYEITSLDHRDKVIPSAEIVLRPVNGIRMRFRHRI